MNSEQSAAIGFYRSNPRVVEALQLSRCITPRPGSSKSSVQAFIDQSEDLRTLKEHISRFNIFTALGVGEKEVRHSRVLAWLLRPNGSHGKSDRYLSRFLQLVFGNHPPPQSLSRGLEDVEVHCEDDRIDVLLISHKHRFACAIENKIRASQRKEQLSDYREHLQERYPNYDQKFVYLTLNNEPPADASYLPIDYSAILQHVIDEPAAHGNSTRESELALLFAHYAAVIRSAHGENRINILDILNLRSHELKHSDMIAWLLRPDGSHGLRDEFARFLLRLLVAKGQRFSRNPDEWSLGDLIAWREREKIDIFAVSERNRLVVVLENKVAAKEHGEQLANRRSFIARHYDGDELIYVFLDMKSAIPSDPAYVAIGYSDLLPFFESRVDRAVALTATEIIELIVQHYYDLIAYHLWVKRRQTWHLPNKLQLLCERIAQRDAPTVSTLLEEVKNWQVALFKSLEPFLYTLADRFFGPCAMKRTYDVWFTFIPAAFTRFSALREGGADSGIDGWLALYQFFVIPFGNAISVRKAGIVIDVKLAPARPEYAAIKARLHAKALENRMLFNRVTRRICENDPLLNYKVCSFEEAVTCDRNDLQRRIENRVERFARGFHPEILSFFSSNLS